MLALLYTQATSKTLLLYPHFIIAGIIDRYYHTWLFFFFFHFYVYGYFVYMDVHHMYRVPEKVRSVYWIF